ncbi:unnamed protein product [Microthlaspi erraticum]|uniref:DC1 domain-containing protein n=1 Tax=Microthlaspi erraticum TaxID=1685480 RepID=A0A6D2IFC7_9BRAS|nr:unnamed protein product [Microthlaspi erraticum]
MDLETESKLVSLITRLISSEDNIDSEPIMHSKVQFQSYVIQIISLLRSTDLDSQPNPESSEFMSLVTQAISLFNSMDVDAQPKPLELISLISLLISSPDSKDSEQMPDFMLLIEKTLNLEPEPELVSLMHQIFSLVVNSKWKKKLICLSPQIEISYQYGKFHIDEVDWRFGNKWNCLPLNWEKFRLTGEDATHFLCRGCNGQSHKEYNKALVEMKHTLHRKQPLQLVLLYAFGSTRECYCCDEDLRGVILYCSTCDFAMNFSCAGKEPVLSIDHPK